MVRSGVSLPIRLSAIAVGTCLAVVLVSRTSHAQTFPRDQQWIPLTCNGQVVTDAAGEVQPPAIDVVGSADNPAAYFYMDGAYLFLRLRIRNRQQLAIVHFVL